MGKRINESLIVLLAIIVLGLLMGGVYSIPAMRITRCRDPWYTILLGIGLSITVTLVGICSNMNGWLFVAASTAAWIILLLLRYLERLDQNLEKYGFVHAVTLVGSLLLAMVLP